MPAFRPFAGKIQNGSKAAALVWQLQPALEHQSRVQHVFCVTHGCTSFIGSAVFASTALCILTVARVPKGGLFGRGISLCCWNNPGPCG